MLTLLRTKWIAPMDQPILREAALVFDAGIIRAIGPATELSREFSRADQIDLGNSILLPGLINAHTHLELSNCTCPDPRPQTFTDWILSLPQRGSHSPAAIEQSIRDATQVGITQSLRFGITCVGDISQYPQHSRPVLADSPLRAVSYAEVLGLATRRPRFEQLLASIDAGQSPNGRITFGISPHAPYTVDLPGYQQALSLAQQNHLPLATHLSEWPAEKDFLMTHTGMFRDLFDRLGFWQDGVQTFPNSPIRFAHSIGLLNYPSLLAHVNYCDDEELNLLSAGRASVVYCPRTHQYFNQPPHRWRGMHAKGINVALGTDSCASSPDLNLLEDLRFLRQLAPEVSAESFWKLVTTNAARAVTLHDQIGSLTPGKFADLIAFSVDTNNPLKELLHDNRLPTHSWIAGDLQKLNDQCPMTNK